MPRMKAVDTLFISSWSSENIPPNGEFEVSDAEAERLEKAGLAKPVRGAKAAPAPVNKMEPAPENKAAKTGKPGGSAPGKRKN